MKRLIHVVCLDTVEASSAHALAVRISMGRSRVPARLRFTNLERLAGGASPHDHNALFNHGHVSRVKSVLAQRPADRLDTKKRLHPKPAGPLMCTHNAARNARPGRARRLRLVRAP